jgi:uncharacterized protein (TIRG00374 family)
MWFALLNVFHRTSLWTAIRIDLITKYVNYLTPSRAVGVMVTPLLFRHYTDHDWTEAITVAGFQMGLYALLYGTVVLVGLVILYRQLPAALLILVVLSALLYFFVAASITVGGSQLTTFVSLGNRAVAAVSFSKYARKLTSIVRSQIPSFSSDSTEIFRRIATDPSAVFQYSAAWVSTILVLRSIRVWLLLVAFGVDFQPLVLLPVVLVTAYSVTVLPLTPGGIGVAEASATIVLVALGVPNDVAVPVVFLDRFLGVYLTVLIAWYPMLDVDLATIGIGNE